MLKSLCDFIYLKQSEKEFMQSSFKVNKLITYIKKKNRVHVNKNVSHILHIHLNLYNCKK